MRNHLSLVALIALAPASASAQCALSAGNHNGAEYAAFESNFPAPEASVAERNAAVMRASLGEDASHSTDADLD
jgi:hypothetical protein